MFRSLAVPHFPKLLLGGFLWNVCRWGFGFLGAFLVNEMTDSARLVQLTGTFLWAPLLFAGAIGGALADRFDRRRLVLAQFLGLIPLTVLMGIFLRSGDVPLWSIYAMMMAAGFGWIIDMTGRRALVFDVVGPELITNAMTLEAISSSMGLILGTIAGGVIIDQLDIASAWMAVAALLGIAVTILWRVPTQIVPHTATVGSTSVVEGQGPGAQEPSNHDSNPGFLDEVMAGLRLVRSNPALASVLGVTVLVNFFHFSYFPITQLVAARLDVTPTLVGVLAAGTGIGMLLGATWVLVFTPTRGRSYVFGAIGAFLAIVGYAVFDVYALVLGSLIVASFFIGWFAANQAAIVMTVVDGAVRGRAMGLLTMSIGSLPVGMYALGEMAEWVGVTAALVTFNLVGAGSLIIWLTRRPQVYHQA